MDSAVRQLLRLAREVVAANGINDAIGMLVSAIEASGRTLRGDPASLAKRKYQDAVSGRDSLTGFVDSLQGLGVNIEKLWDVLKRKGFSSFPKGEEAAKAANQIVAWLETPGGVKRFTSFRGY